MVLSIHYEFVFKLLLFCCSSDYDILPLVFKGLYLLLCFGFKFIDCSGLCYFCMIFYLDLGFRVVSIDFDSKFSVDH